MITILRTFATVAVLVGAAEAFVPHHTRAMHAGPVRMGAEPQRMGGLGKGSPVSESMAW